MTLHASGKSFEARGVVLRGRRWLLGMWAVLQGSGLAMLLSHLLDWNALGWVLVGGVLCMVAPILVTVYAWSARKWPERSPVRLIADPSGLRVDGSVINRQSLVAGYVLATPEPAVRLIRRGRHPSIDLELPMQTDAVQLVEALGLGVTRGTARFHAVYGGTVRRFLVLFCAMFAYLFLFALAMSVVDGFTRRGLPPAAIALFWTVLGLLPLLGQLVFRTDIDVGADGIWLSKGNQFLPYTEILQVTALDRDILLVKRSGERIRLGFGGSVRQHEASAACMQRIDEARAARASEGAAVSPEALLSPAGRSPGEWLDALRVVADYRSSAVPDDILWRIVEDPNAAGPTRAGAAIALGHGLDAEARQRLRVAAQACAAPRLRVAFELVAEEVEVDQARLETALERVVKG
jgi:hypothetical protein